jgi:hypothetical protein
MREGRRGRRHVGVSHVSDQPWRSHPVGRDHRRRSPVRDGMGRSVTHIPAVYHRPRIPNSVRFRVRSVREPEKLQHGTADVALKISCATCLGESRTQPATSVARRPGSPADGLPSRSAGAPQRVFLSIVLESARHLHSTNTFGLSASGACDMLLALGGKP